MKKIYLIKALLLIIMFCIITGAMNAQEEPISDKHIIFVGNESDEAGLELSEPGDKNLIDSLSKWVYVDYMPSISFNTAETSVLYDGVDGVIISESISSNAVPNFGPDRDNFPVPSIVMEMSALDNQPDRWNMYSATGGKEEYGSPEAGDLQWTIIDTANYITKIYDLYEIVDYATGDPGRGMAYIYGLKDQVIRLAEPNRTLVNEEAFAIGIIQNVNNGILFMSIAKTYPAPGVASQDLFTILKRAVEYMFEAYPTNLDEVTKNRNNLSFYPNPAQDYLNVMFPSKAGKLAEISLVNLTGQKVAISSFKTITGVNNVSVNLNGMARGIYFVQLELDNEVTVEKVMIK